jgi:uncharacterized damage-inducible protein DinB
MSDARVQSALRALGPKEKPWFGGPSPAGSLRGVDMDLATRRSAGLKHCIWELALHIAYWEYAVRRVLVDGPKGGFPRTPSNWPSMPADPSDRLWRADRALAKQERVALVVELKNLDAKRLDERASAISERTVGDLLIGIIQHSAYHTGQIALLKRLK